MGQNSQEWIGVSICYIKILLKMLSRDACTWKLEPINFICLKYLEILKQYGMKWYYFHFKIYNLFNNLIVGGGEFEMCKFMLKTLRNVNWIRRLKTFIIFNLNNNIIN